MIPVPSRMRQGWRPQPEADLIDGPDEGDRLFRCAGNGHGAIEGIRW